MRDDQRGFVLNGIALLLILPALLLAGVCVKLVEIGGETVSIQGVADKVFYTGHDLERALQLTWDENLLFDNERNANNTLAELAENYRNTTGLLVEITPAWKIWTFGKPFNENFYAGSEHCRIAHVSQDNWYYYFEMDSPSTGDWNEPILLVTKQTDNLKITLVNYHYAWMNPDNWSNIYYDNILLWNHVIHLDPRIGDENVVSGTTQLVVSIDVRDPSGTARYTSTVELG